MPEGRDSKVRFIKNSVPWDKGADSGGIIFTCRFCGQRKHIEEVRFTTRFSPPLPTCKDCWKLLE